MPRLMRLLGDRQLEFIRFWYRPSQNAVHITGGGVRLKLEIIFVTYDGGRRKEEQWVNISQEQKMQLARVLTGIFMNIAGFSRAECQDSSLENAVMH